MGNHYGGVNAEIIADTGIGELTVIPAYRRAELDVNFNGPAFRGGLNREVDEQFSLEARLQGKPLGPVEWLVGGYYFDESVDGKYSFNQYVVNAFVDFTTKTKSYAAFGRLTANLTDRFRLVGGLRYTHDNKSFIADAPTLVQVCTVAMPTGCFGGPSLPTYISLAELAASGVTVPTVPGGAGSVAYGTAGNRLVLAPLTIDQQQSFSRVTYRAAVEFDVGPQSLLYASYETGYRSGGFSASLGHEQVRPEYVDAVTVGSKNRFFDNRIQLNIEGFWWKYRDQQISHFGPDSGGNNSFFSENIGRATIKGIDVEAQFLIMPTTLLRGNVQYLDSKVNQFTYDLRRSFVITGVPSTEIYPVVGCPYAVATNSAGQSVNRVDCSGQAGYNAPKWSINFGLEQTVNLGDYKVVLNGDMRYRSRRWVGFDYLPQQSAPGVTVYDASIQFGPQSEKWSLVGFVRNLSNANVPVLTQFASSTGNVLVSQYQPPRTYGIRGIMKF
jgi:iron complex outermembrane recepter protein